MILLTSTKSLILLKVRILNEAKKTLGQKYKLAAFSIGSVFVPAILILSVPGNVVLKKNSSLLSTLLATLSLVFISALIQYLYYWLKTKKHLYIYHYLDSSAKNQAFSDFIAFKAVDPTLLIFLAPVFVNPLGSSRLYLYAAVFFLSLIAQYCLLYIIHSTSRVNFLNYLSPIPNPLLGGLNYIVLFFWYVMVLIFQFNMIYFAYLLIFSLFAVNTKANLHDNVCLPYLKRIPVAKIYIASSVKYSLVYAILSLTLLATHTITLTMLLYSYVLIFSLALLSWYISKITLTLAFLFWLIISLSL